MISNPFLLPIYADCDRYCSNEGKKIPIYLWIVIFPLHNILEKTTVEAPLIPVIGKAMDAGG